MEERSELCIELGFIEKVESWKLRSKYFPSKVGGWPAWLSLESLPMEKDLHCQKCQKSLIFLCQIYAPIESLEHCFHRTIFVFICRDGNCCSENDASNLKAFRSQLPRKNKYYSFEPPKIEERDNDKPSASDFVKVCRVCGLLGPKVCGNCKLVNYCSRDHQAVDWKAGHKLECPNKDHLNTLIGIGKMVIRKVGKGCEADAVILELRKDSTAFMDLLFPEYEIDLEPEEIEEENKTEEEVVADYEKLLKKGQISLNDNEALNENDLLKMAARETDNQFAKFRTRIDFYPDQTIRYHKGGTPLFVSSEHKPKEIPNCEKCGAQRSFEFQIMPQLLVHLNVDNPGCSIDWGTILIYSCPNSCSSDNEMYTQEFVYKQDYSPSTDFLRQ